MMKIPEPKPKPTGECLSCADFWDYHNPPKPRMKLVLIGSTMNAKAAVLACPYCDGERAISLAKTKGE
jgi:hypothetical protein